MSTKNEAIGQVECPAKGCALLVPVFRFKARPNERMQRFANKLYCRCPKHGQFGGAASDEAMQDYITENSTKCPSESAGNGQTATPATPAIHQQAPAATKAPAAPKLPANQPAAKPAAEPEQPAKKSSWFGL